MSSLQTLSLILAVIVLSSVFVGESLYRFIRQSCRGHQESPEFWQLCREELERDREERKEKENQKRQRSAPLRLRESFELLRPPPRYN